MAITHVGIGLTGTKLSLDVATNLHDEDDAKVIFCDSTCENKIAFYKAYVGTPESTDSPTYIACINGEGWFELAGIQITDITLVNPSDNTDQCAIGLNSSGDCEINPNNGGVNLYHEGSKVAYTTSSGLVGAVWG